MCLDLLRQKDGKFLDEVEKTPDGKLKVWKILYKQQDDDDNNEYHLYSPFCSPYVNRYTNKNIEWKPGETVSTREQVNLTCQEKYGTRVDHGIHVFMTKQNAENFLKALVLQLGWSNEFPNSCVIVPLYADKDDFVASSEKLYWVKPDGPKDTPIMEVVFSKVTFKQEDYQEAIAEKEVLCA